MNKLMQWAVVGMVAAGCGGGSSGSVMNPSVYTSVTISPSSTNAYEFSATTTKVNVFPADQNGHSMATTGGTAVWHILPSGIATIDGSGNITVTSATPTALTITVDFTLQGITETSPSIQVQTDLAPVVEQVTTAGTSFTPVTVHIKAGGTVNWSGLMPNHNVHFSSATPFAGAALNGAPGSSNSASGSFAAAGSFAYQCDTHGPAMSGTVVVH